MKLVVVGGTGFVGAEVLSKSLQNPTITSIVVLTRRQLPSELQENPKIISIVTAKFSELSADAREQLKDASAVIWALRATSKEVELEWPLSFAQTIQEIRQPGTPCRYVHVSGVMAEKDQEKPLWFLQEGRRTKGMAEIKLLELSKKNAWESYVMRPSMILPVKPGIVSRIAGLMLGAIGVDQLADVMISIASRGSEMVSFENADLVRYAKQLGD